MAILCWMLKLQALVLMHCSMMPISIETSYCLPPVIQCDFPNTSVENIEIEKDAHCLVRLTPTLAVLQ